MMLLLVVVEQFIRSHRLIHSYVPLIFLVGKKSRFC